MRIGLRCSRLSQIRVIKHHCALVAFLLVIGAGCSALHAQAISTVPINLLSTTGGTAFSENSLAEKYGRLPLSFEVNQGQADRRVKFLSRGGDYALFLTRNEMVLALQKGGSERKPSPTVPRPVGKHISSETTGVLRMSLIGASRAVRVSGVDRLPGSANYFLGNDQRNGRRMFRRTPR